MAAMPIGGRFGGSTSPSASLGVAGRYIQFPPACNQLAVLKAGEVIPNNNVALGERGGYFLLLQKSALLTVLRADLL